MSPLLAAAVATLTAASVIAAWLFAIAVTVEAMIQWANDRPIKSIVLWGVAFACFTSAIMPITGLVLAVEVWP